MFTLTLSSSVDPESLILIFSTKSVTNAASIVTDSNQRLGPMICTRNLERINVIRSKAFAFAICGNKNQEMREETKKRLERREKDGAADKSDSVT